MKTLAQNLFLLIGGTVGFLSIGVGLTLLVKYKPWGVPDVLREKYDAKLIALDERRTLIDHWDGKPRPKISIRSNHDVGARPNNSDQTYRLSFRNDGQLPLTLKGIGSSNEASFASSNKPVQPGEEGQVTIRWLTMDTPGPFKFTSFFRSNDPLQESLQIEFRGRIKAKILMPQRVAFPASNLGETSKTEFLIHSELWDTFDVTNIQSSSLKPDWNAKRISAEGTEFTSTIQITLLNSFLDYGKHEHDLTITAQGPASEIITTTIKLQGMVNQPIRFLGPEIHKTDGLDMGVVDSSKQHSFHLNCKINGAPSRTIEVLDVSPKTLQAKLTKQSIAGNYRLTIIVPEGCPTVVFNTTKQGYIKVGDPEDEQFSNWLPLHGVVLTKQPY